MRRGVLPAALFAEDAQDSVTPLVRAREEVQRQAVCLHLPAQNPPATEEHLQDTGCATVAHHVLSSRCHAGRPRLPGRRRVPPDAVPH